MKTIVTNRKARYEYFIEESFEAGISLLGSEVKSIRLNQVSLADSYVSVENGQVYIVNMHIAKFKQSNQFNHDELRKRKLLLNKREIKKLEDAVVLKGYTIIPLKLYFKENLIKLEIAIARGKALYDKRESIKERDIKREIAKSLKNY